MLLNVAITKSKVVLSSNGRSLELTLKDSSNLSRLVHNVAEEICRDPSKSYDFCKNPKLPHKLLLEQLKRQREFTFTYKGKEYIYATKGMTSEGVHILDPERIIEAHDKLQQLLSPEEFEVYNRYRETLISRRQTPTEQVEPEETNIVNFDDIKTFETILKEVF